MKLYFLRHGPALTRDEWDRADSERPLSPDGARVVAVVAERLDALGVRLDIIVSSPYERALRTAIIVHEMLGSMPALVEDARLEPGAFTPVTLAGLVGDHRLERAVMLVGHEPSMGSVLASLIGADSIAFKKAGIARVDMDPATPDRGELRWFAPPRLL